MSWAEQLVRSAFNYLTGIGVQVLLFPLVHVRMSLGENALLGLAFMANSIAGGYATRRLFNALPYLKGTRSLDKRSRTGSPDRRG